MDKCLYERYVRILHEELLPAMGCTEPISVAYAAALSRDILGAMPDRAVISVSGNILKNVKSVVVPNTGGMKGVNCAAAAGIVAGDAEKKLEVISSVTPADKEKITIFMKTVKFTVEQSHSGCIFDIAVKLFKGSDWACVRIAGHHTNVVLIEKNGKDILNLNYKSDEPAHCADKDLLSVDRILEFADTVAINDVAEIIKRQIEWAFEGGMGFAGRNMYNL